MIIKRKKKIGNLNATLKNYLSYMLDNVERLTEELNNEYTPAEKREFVYNCTVNTIFEFIQEDKCYLVPMLGTHKIVKLFKVNWLLQQFHEPEINPDMSPLTRDIVKMYAALNLPLSDYDKNDVMAGVNKLIASTI